MDGAQIDGKVVRAKFTLPERKKIPSPSKAVATTSRRDGPKSEDAAAADGEKDGAPKRPREASPRRKPPSPPRRRSPIARRGSPRRGPPDSPPPRRRQDSPPRRRPDSPYRRGGSPPPRRRPGSPAARGRSPSSPPRRFRSPARFDFRIVLQIAGISKKDARRKSCSPAISSTKTKVPKTCSKSSTKVSYWSPTTQSLPCEEATSFSITIPLSKETHVILCAEAGAHHLDVVDNLILHHLAHAGDLAGYQGAVVLGGPSEVEVLAAAGAGAGAAAGARAAHPLQPVSLKSVDELKA
ncbi:arginine/serine-rich 45 protein [Striga asiatica]|uniref:Arginine/serine-rich 45 protein n=1 Tax=Striga asiatica TaxID=4170 RepID=A0A5A7R7T2_STRAF|nr:arginine/serine-rich 45 protein [Striga asiatica]